MKTALFCVYVFIQEQNKSDEKQLEEHVASKQLHNQRGKDWDSHSAPNIWFSIPVALPTPPFKGYQILKWFHRWPSF